MKLKNVNLVDGNEKGGDDDVGGDGLHDSWRTDRQSDIGDYKVASATQNSSIQRQNSNIFFVLSKHKLIFFNFTRSCCTDQPSSSRQEDEEECNEIETSTNTTDNDSSSR